MVHMCLRSTALGSSCYITVVAVKPSVRLSNKVQVSQQEKSPRVGQIRIGQTERPVREQKRSSDLKGEMSADISTLTKQARDSVSASKLEES